MLGAERQPRRGCRPKPRVAVCGYPGLTRQQNPTPKGLQNIRTRLMKCPLYNPFAVASSFGTAPRVAADGNPGLRSSTPFGVDRSALSTEIISFKKLSTTRLVSKRSSAIFEEDPPNVLSTLSSAARQDSRHALILVDDSALNNQPFSPGIKASKQFPTLSESMSGKPAQSASTTASGFGSRSDGSTNVSATA